MIPPAEPFANELDLPLPSLQKANEIEELYLCSNLLCVCAKPSSVNSSVRLEKSAKSKLCRIESLGDPKGK